MTTESDPIRMNLSARSTLNLECVEVRFLCCIKRLKIGDTTSNISGTNAKVSHHYPIKSAVRVKANIVANLDPLIV